MPSSNDKSARPGLLSLEQLELTLQAQHCFAGAGDFYLCDVFVSGTSVVGLISGYREPPSSKFLQIGYTTKTPWITAGWRKDGFWLLSTPMFRYVVVDWRDGVPMNAWKTLPGESRVRNK